MIQLDDLGNASRRLNPKKKLALHTPPDFGILTTIKCEPYSRCISTFNFSWPTTRITLTIWQEPVSFDDDVCSANVETNF